MFKKHIDKICDEQKASLRNWGNEASKDIGKNKETLEDHKLRLQGAQAMAKQLISSGSDHDIAAMFCQLKTSFGDLSRDKPVIDKTEKDYEVKFDADTDLESKKTALGKLKFGNKPLGSGGAGLQSPHQKSAGREKENEEKGGKKERREEKKKREGKKERT